MGGPTTGAPRTSCSCFCFEAKTACDLLCPGGKGPSHSSRCCANRGLDIGACAEEADTEFGRRIVGAEPRSCLALRFGRTHRECTVSPPLLNCALCWNREVASTCEPLLVAGRGHRDSSGQPPTTARRSPRRADQEHGGASRAGAGQPAQPGPRRVPRQQRLPHRSTEQTRHRWNPEADGRPGQPFDHAAGRSNPRLRAPFSDASPIPLPEGSRLPVRTSSPNRV